MNRPYRLGLYEKAMPNALSIAEKLLVTKEFGYDFMEISIDETPEKLARLDMPSSKRAALRQASLAAALPIQTMCLSGHRKYPLGASGAEGRRESVEIMEKAIHLACDIGVRVIQIAGYDVYYETSTADTRRYFLENLRYCVSYAAKYGVVLAFETMETPFMDNVKKAMAYVRELCSPYLQVYPDAGNCANAALLYGEDVVSDLRGGRGHIAALHLKEAAPGKYREVAYGTGHVDFESLISEALRQGVGLFVTEFWDAPSIDYRAQIGSSKSFIDLKFAAALNRLKTT